MGKRIIAQARGKGGPRYTAPSHKYAGRVTYPSSKTKGVVVDICHDPGRNSPVAKVSTPLGEFLMIAVEGLKVGDEVEIMGRVSRGCIARLCDIPEGVPICGIESYPMSGPRFCRGSGTYATIISKEKKITVKMPSGKFKEFHPNCLATVGIPAGGGRYDKPFVKAGQAFYAAKARNRLWPRTSAVKMNAVDHPFGGSTKPGKPKTVSRDMPPGKKVGSISARRTGKKKR